MTQRRVLFTGSRDWSDRDAIANIIKTLPSDSLVIEGGAQGADRMAYEEAVKANLQTMTFVAEWSKLGKMAGPIRNQRMIDEGKPTEAFAFPLVHGCGTFNMIKLLRKAGVPVIVDLTHMTGDRK